MDITKSTVSFIKSFVIPELFLETGKLKPEFKFLDSVQDYLQYYGDLGGRFNLERQLAQAAKFTEPVKILKIGLLEPIKLSHSRDSFWKCFRRGILLAKRQGRNEDELSLFLPLEAYLPIEPMKVNNKQFEAEFRVYLFPFGSLITNLRIKVENLSLDDFVDFMQRLDGSRLRTIIPKKADQGTFKQFSQDIAAETAKAVFEDSNLGSVSQFGSHKMLYFEETSPEMQYSSDTHMIAIKAVMTGRTIKNVSSETIGKVADYLEESDQAKKRKTRLRLESFRNYEILIFNPHSSFFYKSPDWREEHYVRGPMCMQRNYEGFLIFLFALNRFLKVFLPKDKNVFPPPKLSELRTALSLAFKEEPYSIYYKRITPKILESMGLDELIKEAKDKW